VIVSADRVGIWMADEIAARGPRFTSFTMVLPVYDEAARVRRAIAYYGSYAPILVVDNCSRDGSGDIARGLGAEVVRHPNAGTIQTPEWFRHVAGLVGTDHFVLLSCSEFLPGALLQRYDEVARARSADVVSCARVSLTAGEELPAVHGESRVERFFAKDGLDYGRIAIHRPFRPLRAERLLQLPWDARYRVVHLRDADAPSLMRKHTEYAAVEAAHLLRDGVAVGLRWLLRALLGEARRYLRVVARGGTRIARREVWARAVMHTITWWVAWELREGRTLAWSQERSDRVWSDLSAAQER